MRPIKSFPHGFLSTRNTLSKTAIKLIKEGWIDEMSKAAKHIQKNGGQVLVAGKYLIEKF